MVEGEGLWCGYPLHGRLRESVGSVRKKYCGVPQICGGSVREMVQRGREGEALVIVVSVRNREGEALEV